VNIEKNKRVYLVLDPDEAEVVEHLLSKGPVQPGSPVKRILSRLRDSMMRARAKGSKFSTVAWRDRG
jgi:hypothetical protein